MGKAKKSDNLGNEGIDMLKDIQKQVSTNRDNIGAINVSIGSIETEQVFVRKDTTWIKDHMTKAIDRKVDWRVFSLILFLSISLMGFGYSVYADDDEDQDKAIEEVQEDISELKDGFDDLKHGQDSIESKLDDLIEEKDDDDDEEENE